MFDMTADELTLTRTLVRGLEFRLVPELIGQQFRAGSIDDLLLSAPLLELVGLEGALQTSALNIEQTLVKYGIVDLRFRIDGAAPSSGALRDVPIRELLGDTSLDRGREPAQERKERLHCLELLRDEVATGHRELTVFARALDMPELSRRERLGAALRKERPFELFPRELEVTDAYITNASSIGLARHFYL